MALKFLNKKGWHTGSLRNIENVWKAEQKHNAEEKKLEELQKQIHEERERSEFRLLQEQAGLVPKQERLEFLYESGLAVGKVISEGFKTLEPPLPNTTDTTTSSSSSKTQPLAPGALFEDKPQSANDAWRKLHSDPLLLIRQQEQQAIARIKKNPVQMAIIRNSVAAEKHIKEKRSKKDHKKHYSKREKRSYKGRSDSDSEVDAKKDKSYKNSKHGRHRSETNKTISDATIQEDEGRERIRHNSRYEERHWYDKEADDAREKKIRPNSKHEKNYHSETGGNATDALPSVHWHSSRPKQQPKLSEEEKAAKLREMQLDAELHEENRWKRLKKASENDAREAAVNLKSDGRGHFLDAAKKSVYGAEKGGSSTIEESVRRRKYYTQGRSGDTEDNAFRR
ncbi:hypothetical protein GIB67_006757 [Kingdonia uniflora]|uniref:CBF1-interacting co-repressor CIR N-terminal domain-containing protein n=1 Tax=Kingdonia uniflora TaxID=39325 RepID=A0A7J7LYY8_9MAGN|nr:hypothetical protein GIB67_006757 [Kingdonia uniflora]